MAKVSKAEPKILLVEDHPDLVEMYRFVFERRVKAKLFVAGDKASGLMDAKKVKPDLLLLDIIIPESKTTGFEPIARYGFQLLEQIRGDKDLKDVKVIVLTNLESPEDRARAEELGAIDYIIKAHTLPYEVAALVNKALK